MPADVSQMEAFAARAAKAGSKIRYEQAKTVKATTEKVAADARDNAPIGPTGDLHDSIEPSANGLKGTVTVGVSYGAFPEYGTWKDDPQPYLGPARDANEGQYREESLAAVQRALGRL